MVLRKLLVVCAVAVALSGCATASAPAPPATADSVPAPAVAQAVENQKRVNDLRMGQTLIEVERVMGGRPERRHARLRFDGVSIEEWSYSTDPVRKLDTVVTFVGGKVDEINTASWERRKREPDPRQTESQTAAAAADAENDAIVAVVDRAYVRGVHIEGDPELMRSGMHDSFVMFTQSEKGITEVTRDAWIERLAAAKANEMSAPKPEITAAITVLDRSGKAAVTKVALFRDGKQIFTDYISLYRFNDGWKLVAKTFNRH